jgi:uncharacterized glyoxalase superfamily protein PhnB
MLAPEEATMGSTVIPAIRYRDAARMVDWVCDAFGFTRHLVVPGEHGTIAHAELTLGPGMVMIGSARDDAYGRLVRTVREGGAATQGLYVVVPDADAHCTRARAAGAEIAMEPKDEDYGGRGYTARDPEGHVWTFGTFDPWRS